jgi:predicted anti-sigma-YlaC factor YlaD
MRPQRTLSALLVATLTLTACSSLFSSSGPSGVTEEQVRNACESTDTNTLASQTDRRWYAESCSNLD